MPMKIVGPERMINWVPKGTEGRNLLGAPRAPTRGLGPEGMVGSVGYNQNSLSPQAQKWERMGLYWTGSGIAQGRPLAEIEQGIGLAGRADARSERGMSLNEKTGLAGIDLNERQFTESKSNNLLNFGLASRREDREGAQLQATTDLAKNADRRATFNLASELTPDSQRAMFNGLGEKLPESPMERVAKSGPPPDPFAQSTDNNDVEAARQALALNPKDPNYERNLKRVAVDYKVKGGHGGLKLLVQRHGPAIAAEDARRLGPSVDQSRVEAIFQRYGGKYTHEQIKAKLLNNAQ